MKKAYGLKRAPGYVFPLTLAIVGVLSTLFVLIGGYTSNQNLRTAIGYTEMKLKWAAEGALVETFHRYKSDPRALSSDGRTMDYAGYKVELKKNTSTRELNLISLRAKTGEGGFTAKSSVLLLEGFYSDYLLHTLGDYTIDPLGAGGNRFFFGPLQFAGDVYVNGGGIHFYDLPGFERTNLGSQKTFRLDGENEIFNPVLVGKAYPKWDEKYPVAGVEFEMNLKSALKDRPDLAQENIKRMYMLEDYGFGELYRTAKIQADERYDLSFQNRGIFKKKKVINEYLLEKDLVGIGNGSSTAFSFTKRVKKPQRIYLRDVSDKLTADLGFRRSYKVHPQRDQPSPGVDFKLSNGLLRFEKPKNWVRLKLEGDSFDRIGRIKFRNPQSSAVTKGRKLLALRVSLGANLYELEDNTYTVDWQSGYINLEDPSLIQAVWQEVGVTDGTSRVYDHALGGGFAVLVDGDTVEADIGLDSLKLKATYTSGLPIHILVTKPAVDVKKSPPDFQVGVFVDKQIPLIDLNLNQLVPFPDYGLIVSKVPLRIWGNPIRPLTIICTEDVYLGSINKGLKTPKTVAVISGKMVWALETQDKAAAFKLKADSKQLHLNHVIVLSKADDFVIKDAEAKTFYPGQKPALNLFQGSLFLSGGLRNLYHYRNTEFAQDTDVALGEFYYYHSGQISAFHYFYPNRFQNSELLPNLVPTSLRLVEWSRDTGLR